MKSYVFDASAFLRFIEGGAGAERVEALILQAEAGRAQIALSAVNWGEIYYVIARKDSANRAAAFSATIRNLPIEIVPADQTRAEGAGIFHNRYSLPYADAFAASLADSQDATLVTGDNDFRSVASAISVEFLPASGKP